MQSAHGNSSCATDNAVSHLYEYAVVRYMPAVEREEFVNVGLVMMCKRQRWIRSRISLPDRLMHALCPTTDMQRIREQLKAFELICTGVSDSPVASLDAHERFRWLTAVRSACITTSRPHPGKTGDLDAEFDRLFDQLVCR